MASATKIRRRKAPRAGPKPLSFTGPGPCRPRMRPTVHELSPEVFDKLSNHLSVLYQDHEMRQVRELGLCFYGVKGTLSTYKKRFAERTNVRKNERGSKMRRDPGKNRPPTDIVRGKDFVMSVPEVDRPMTLGRFRSQITMITCVDRFVRGVFDAGAHGWTDVPADTAGPRTLAQQAKVWDSLSDLCYGASVLVQRRLIGKANICLERFLSRVERSFDLQDPSLVALFWRICLQLRGIEHRWPQSQILYRFFEKLKSLVQSRYGHSTHDLFQLVDALCNVWKEDFEETLRIGYFKSIDVFANQVGDDQPTVLHMASVYYHYWPPGNESVKHSLILKLNGSWHDACDSGDETEITTALHNLVYAQYVYKRPHLIIQEGRDLFNRTSSLEFRGPWDITARALAYSAKVVSTFYNKHGDYGQCQSHMLTAIENLELGSSDHQIRAMLLSSTLEKWQKKWGRHRDAEFEQARQVGLLIKIDGPEVCLRCVQRNTLCQRCARQHIQKKGRKKKKVKSVDLPVQPHPVSSSSYKQFL